MKNTNLYLAFLFLFFSCQHDEEINIVFWGDSHVRNWDINYWFPASKNTNHGVSGLKTNDLIAISNGFNSKEKQIVWIGINDIIGASNKLSDSIFHSILHNFDSITDKLKIGDCVISILPVTSFYKNESVININKMVVKINDHLKTICIKKNLIYIDIHSELSNDLYLDEMYSLDGLHLNNLGYELVSKEVRSNIN